MKAITTTQSIKIQDLTTIPKPLEHPKQYFIQSTFNHQPTNIQQSNTRNSFKFTYNKPIEQRQEQIVPQNSKSVHQVRLDRPPMPRSKKIEPVKFIKPQITFNHQKIQNLAKNS